MYLKQVINIPKYAAEDTTLTTSTIDGTPVVVPIPAGSAITMHVPGLHYNSASRRSMTGRSC